MNRKEFWDRFNWAAGIEPYQFGVLLTYEPEREKVNTVHGGEKVTLPAGLVYSGTSSCTGMRKFRTVKDAIAFVKDVGADKVIEHFKDGWG